MVSSPAVNGISDPSQENNRRSSIPLPISSVVSAISSTVISKPNNNALSQQTPPISQGKLLRNKLVSVFGPIIGTQDIAKYTPPRDLQCITRRCAARYALKITRGLCICQYTQSTLCVLLQY